MTTESNHRKCAYLLADKHLRELPTEAIINSAPSHYGTTLTDDHRNFMWNALVEHYEATPFWQVYKLYITHIKEGKAIIRSYAYGEISPKEQEIVDLVTAALWEELPDLNQNND